jgi:hypothetical protein
MSSDSSLARVMALLADSTAATFASLWPWSAASVEVRRLAANGYPAGERADVFYLVSFDAPPPDDALRAVRAAGFSIREPAPSSGFLTVRAAIRMGAYDLMIVGSRLDRLVARYDGFATLIGAGRLEREERAAKRELEEPAISRSA